MRTVAAGMVRRRNSLACGSRPSTSRTCSLGPRCSTTPPARRCARRSLRMRGSTRCWRRSRRGHDAPGLHGVRVSRAQRRPWHRHARARRGQRQARPHPALAGAVRPRHRRRCPPQGRVAGCCAALGGPSGAGRGGARRLRPPCALGRPRGMTDRHQADPASGRSRIRPIRHRDDPASRRWRMPAAPGPLACGGVARRAAAYSSRMAWRRLSRIGLRK